MKEDIFVVVEQFGGKVADISYVMLAAGNELTKQSDGELVAVLLGHEVDQLPQDLKADRVLYINDPSLADFNPETYISALEEIIKARSPRAVLFGHTTMGMDVVSEISVELNLPIVSQCQRVRWEDGVAKFISQICGGKIMVEGYFPDPIVLITMAPGGYKPELGQTQDPPPVETVPIPAPKARRTNVVGYLEPEVEDVDISRESILISVGRGIEREDNLEMVERLAERLGGAVSASRPVVDQGWLPTTRMVGKSGRVVKPKLYLALGISGAPEHVEGLMDSECIIAVNIDPAAPIFDVAQYGAEIDMFDLIPALLERLE